ncbi:heparinase II/III family protein [Vulgatibacter incomptus]|uniref:Uncharacterized protein n=1 Tax=Vulgatibacter incomptus TaxID=1391653 RepID=A0A0K1PC29_9BACT|nr:heparinase II/III-family protein [Vulgatibacter incomptus]AKU90669.1 hypothetical protein AKJ08_1056 [Vulgatibacter incomptus]
MLPVSIFGSLGWLAYLARVVSARRLAEVASKRILRQVRRPLTERPEPPSATAILDSFGAGSASALPRRLAEPIRGPLALASPGRVARSARALQDRLPLEAERAVERAERALARNVVVFGRTVPLPVSERAVPLASRGWRAIDWEVCPLSGARFHGARVPAGADPKFPWVVGRMEDVVHLACGARLAEPWRARAFADAAVDRMLDLAAAPRGIQWSCPMEVALRAANQAIALRLLAGEEVLQRRPWAVCELLRSIAFHVAWVKGRLEDDRAVPNNHLVADLAGILLVCALLPRLPGARATARLAAMGLANALFEQTLPDGTSFEGSLPYHRLATELFFLGELAADTAGVPFPERGRERLRAMFLTCADLVDGRGLLPQIGDCDSGQAIPFCPRESAEVAWLLPIGAARFGAAELNRSELRRSQPSPELIWLLGEGGARRLERLPRARPPRDGARADAGIRVIRSARMSCAIACGPNGTGGTGTHGHNDKLSVEICVDGALVVGDPGTGSYTGDPMLRNLLRGTAAHSTVRVDGEEQQPIPPTRLFALPDSAWARCVAFESTETEARFVGEHRGYLRLKPGIVHRREVRLDRVGERLLIEDRLIGSGPHGAEIRFLLPGAHATTRKIRDEEGAVFGAEPRWIVEVGPRGAPLALLAGPSRPRLEDAICSPGYGRTERALCVVFAVEGEPPVVHRTWIVPAASHAGRPSI